MICDYSKYQRYAMILLGIAMMTGFIGDPPLLSYAATKLNRPANSGKNAAKIVVNVISIDNGDPVQSTIKYKVDGQGTIHNVVFTAPGQNSITAASEGRTFEFHFNQKKIGYDSHEFTLDYKETPGSTSVSTSVTMDSHTPNRTGQMWFTTTEIDGEPRRSVPIITDLIETYHTYRYSVPVLYGNKNIWLGEGTLMLTLGQGAAKEGVDKVNSVDVNHWYSNNQKSTTLLQSMVSPDLPYYSQDGGLALDCDSDSTFKPGNGLTGHDRVIHFIPADALGALYGTLRDQ